MATFADLLLDVRMQLPDELAREVTDAVIFAQAIKAYRRINHILFRKSLSVGKVYATIPMVADTAIYDLPLDFMIDDGLFRDDGLPLRKIDDREYQTLVSAPECSLYLLRGQKVHIAETPKTERNLTLVYWPLLAVTDLKASSPTPYDGKFNDMVVEYLVMVFAASHGTSNTQGKAFYQDLESTILSTYAHLDPVMSRQRGWVY